MHIPQGDTAAMEILSFEEAAERSTSEDYDRDKWLYVPDFYTEYRYVLGTRGEYPVICAGINPSTAEPDNLDPTLKSVSRIAAANAFDSWMMFNVYAQRATRPDDMDTERNELLHHENMEAFRTLLQLAACSGRKPIVWAAWGAIIEKRFWLMDCVCTCWEWTSVHCGSVRGSVRKPDIRIIRFILERMSCFIPSTWEDICDENCHCRYREGRPHGCGRSLGRGERCHRYRP